VTAAATSANIGRRQTRGGTRGCRDGAARTFG
jgi:hypothetical protein